MLRRFKYNWLSNQLVSRGAERLLGRTVKNSETQGEEASYSAARRIDPLESFRSLLAKGYTQERKSNAGRKRIDPLILLKILLK